MWFKSTTKSCSLSSGCHRAAASIVCCSTTINAYILPANWWTHTHWKNLPHTHCVLCSHCYVTLCFPAELYYLVSQLHVLVCTAGGGRVGLCLYLHTAHVNESTACGCVRELHLWVSPLVLLISRVQSQITSFVVPTDLPPSLPPSLSPLPSVALRSGAGMRWIRLVWINSTIFGFGSKHQSFLLLLHCMYEVCRICIWTYTAKTIDKKSVILQNLVLVFSRANICFINI